METTYLTQEKIDQYIEYTINSGNHQVRLELDWIIKDCQNTKVLETIKELVDDMNA